MTARLHRRRVLVALALLLVAVPAAAVHTALRRSQPAEGAVLNAVPDSMVLEYTERIDLATARVVLRGPSNEPVAISALRHADSSRRVIAVSVTGPVHAGPHAVEWTVLGTDGHVVRGTVRFTIDSGAAGLAPAIDSAEALSEVDTVPVEPVRGDDARLFRLSTALSGVIRFLTFATMLGLIGVAALGSIIVPRSVGLDPVSRERLMAAVTRLGVAAAAGLVLLAGARLLLQVATLGAGSLEGDLVVDLTTGTTWGFAWVLQVVAAVAAWVLLSRQRAGLSLGIACLAIAVSASLSGHPVATPGRAPLAVALDTTHALAAGTWLGSLAMLVLAGIPVTMSLTPGTRGSAVRAVFMAFSPVALWSAAVLVGAGALGALLQLGGVAALFSSDYGRVLLVKLGVFALVIAVAAYNRRRMLPHLGSDDAAMRLRASAGLELVLALAVLVVTTILTVTSPPVTALP